MQTLNAKTRKIKRSMKWLQHIFSFSGSDPQNEKNLFHKLMATKSIIRYPKKDYNSIELCTNNLFTKFQANMFFSMCNGPKTR